MWRPKPSQPRNPWLVAALERQAARQRVKAKRRARRLLIEAGIDPHILATPPPAALHFATCGRNVWL